MIALTIGCCAGIGGGVPNPDLWEVGLWVLAALNGAIGAVGLTIYVVRSMFK